MEHPHVIREKINHMHTQASFRIERVEKIRGVAQKGEGTLNGIKQGSFLEGETPTRGSNGEADKWSMSITFKNGREGTLKGMRPKEGVYA